MSGSPGKDFWLRVEPVLRRHQMLGVAVSLTAVDEGTVDLWVTTDPAKRGGGLASTALREVLGVVDDFDLDVVLVASATRRPDEPEDSPRLDTNQLVSWYSKFGFMARSDTSGGVPMTRLRRTDRP